MRARVAALAAGVFAAIALPPPLAQASEHDRARGAVESCLAEQDSNPSLCEDAAAAFCGQRGEAECRRFETETWLLVASAAEARLLKIAQGPPDEAFVREAAEDLRRRQGAICDQEAGRGPAAEREAIRARCLRGRAAARATALWLIAPRP